jgi:1-phosphofructokinase family hexose kinase
MSICITPNPAVDRTLTLSQLIPGEVHRAEKVVIAAGGKGLNVARSIRTLGGQPLCTGFVGGHAGQLLADLAQEEGLESSWTWVDTETRNCMILVSTDGDATVINEPGAPVTASDWQRLQTDVSQASSQATLVCLSGSLPPDSSADDFRNLLRILLQSGKQVWVDTSGIALDVALAQPGICIKVNGAEISKSLGFEVKDEASAERALSMLGERGIAACVITLGAAGAFLRTKEERWHAQGPSVHVVSTVGSGDSFLGGMVNALDRGSDWEDALRDAVAAGTANALSAGGGRFMMQVFQEIRKQILRRFGSKYR